MKKYLLACLALSIALSCSFQLSPRDLALEKSGSIVMLLDEATGGGGTGFLIRAPSGAAMLLTNGHVCDVVNVIVLGERRVPTKIIERSTSTDLCLMTVPSTFAQPLELADSMPLRYTKIYVLGYGMLLPLALTEGYWFGDLGNPVFNVTHPQYSSAPILPGNSGSPVFNGYGEVVGVVFASGGMIDFRSLIVPLDDIKAFIAPY